MAHLEAKEKVAQLERAIQRLDSVKKHLNTNATDIKAEIHTSINRNLDYMQGRERTLLQQVEKVLCMKEETLQRQQTRLKQALTVLRTGLALVQDDAASVKCLADTLERLNQIELSPEETPYISYRADHVQLRDNILNYGRVDANGLPLMTAFDDPGNPSASLPRQVEEYEDADHHVFYKTVEEVKRNNLTSTGINTINVSIPKLSTRTEDWLQKKLPPTSTGPSSSLSTPSNSSQPVLGQRPAALRPNKLCGGFTEGRVPQTSTPGSSCSLNNWLSLIKQHADLEEEHDFVIVDNSCNKKALSTPQVVRSQDKSSSNTDFFHHIDKNLMMWVKPGTAMASDTKTEDFFSHIPADSKLWLVQAYQQLTSLEELKHRDFFAHISRDASTWLRSRVHSKQQATVGEMASEDRKGFFPTISPDPAIWLQKQKSNPYSGRCSPNKFIDQEKWLLKSPSKVLASTPPSIQMKELCLANEPYLKASISVSQPDCTNMCAQVLSPTKECYRSSNVFKPLELSPSEWLMKTTMETEPVQETVVRPGQTGNLFSHFRTSSDPVWLSKFHQSAPSLSPGLGCKMRKQGASMWLQKKPVSTQEDWVSVSGISSEFCTSDWLMVSPEDRKKDVEMSLGEREETDSWSICSSVHSTSSSQYQRDVVAAHEYYNKWLL